MLNTGDQAPDFELLDHQGTVRRLSDLLLEGDLVLFFYPADFTPGCSAEVCVFRDLHDDLAGLGVKIVGVSPQGPDSHRRFIQQYQLPFILLCDVQRQLIKAFGVNGPLGFGVRRASFLIGKDGLIKNRMVADFKINNHRLFLQSLIDGSQPTHQA